MEGLNPVLEQKVRLHLPLSDIREAGGFVPTTDNMHVAKHLLDDDASLVFANGTSKTVGISGELGDKIRDNAPRISGAMKLAGDVIFGFSGEPLLMAYSAFAIIGRLIMIAYGTKENQEKTANQNKGNLKKDDSIAGNIKKMAHPKSYPIESSAGFSVIAETFGTLYGASLFMEDGRTGYTPLLLGLVAIISYANMLFGKEKDKKPEKANKKENEESLHFAKSQSKAQGFTGKFIQRMKDEPVFASSLMQSAVSAGMIIGGLIEAIPVYVTGGALFLAASLLMAATVTKKGFNVEGAEDKDIKGSTQRPEPQSFAYKETLRRNSGSVLAV
ncbi:MAG: hypothetical protein R3D71_01730 [Rickettsiales bacterium]